MRQYISLQEYDGTLSGRQAFPVSPDDISSPGGLAVAAHRQDGDMFSKRERTYDVYSGTGDRYPYSEYGNIYIPHEHASSNNYIGGPQSAITEKTTLDGKPYFWENMGQSMLHGNNAIRGTQELVKFNPGSINKGASGRNIEGYKNGTSNGAISDLDSSFELINDNSPVTALTPPPQEKKSPFTNSPSPNGKCSPPPTPLPEKFTVLKRVTAHQSSGKVGSSGDDHPWALIIEIIFLFLVLLMIEFWMKSIHSFIKQRLHHGLSISYTRYFLYAILSTFLVVGFVYFTGVKEL